MKKKEKKRRKKTFKSKIKDSHYILIFQHNCEMYILADIK